MSRVPQRTTDTHAHSFAHGAHQKNSTPEKESAREKNENVIQYVSLPWHTQGRQGHTHTAYRTPRTGAQDTQTHQRLSSFESFVCNALNDSYAGYASPMRLLYRTAHSPPRATSHTRE